MDQHVRLLKEAGRSPAATYSTAASLASLAGVPHALVVELGFLATAVVLVSDSIPRVVHQVKLPRSNASPQERADAVARAIEQVVSYHQTATDQSAAPMHLPTVFTGPLATDGSVVGALEAKLPQKPLPLDPPFEWPSHFPIREYATNLGMAVMDWRERGALNRLLFQRGKSSNLLPVRHRPRPLPLIPIAIFGILATFLYVLLVSNAMVQDLSSERAVLSSRVTVLERQERTIRLNQGRTAFITGQIAETALVMLTIGTRLETLDLSMRTLLDQLEATTGLALLGRVQLVSLRKQPNGFFQDGTSYTYEDVLEYSENLRATSLFTDVQIVEVEMSSATGSPAGGQDGAPGAVTFTITTFVALTPP
jgi:hypothetical protein